MAFVRLLVYREQFIDQLALFLRERCSSGRIRFFVKRGTTLVTVVSAGRIFSSAFAAKHNVGVYTGVAGRAHRIDDMGDRHCAAQEGRRHASPSRFYYSTPYVSHRSSGFPSPSVPLLLPLIFPSLPLVNYPAIHMSLKRGPCATI